MLEHPIPACFDKFVKGWMLPINLSCFIRVVSHLAYLADIFGALNELNRQLQARDTNSKKFKNRYSNISYLECSLTRANCLVQLRFSRYHTQHIFLCC